MKSIKSMIKHALSHQDNPVKNALPFIKPAVSNDKRRYITAVLQDLIVSGHLNNVNEVHYELDVSNKNVLEVGCGSCWRAPFFLAYGALSYCGVDPDIDINNCTYANLKTSNLCHSEDREYITSNFSLSEFLSSFTNLQVIQGDLDEVSLQPNTFDTAFMLAVTEHLKEPDRILRKIHELLKPEGTLYLTHGNYYCWSGHHIHPRTVSEYDETNESHRMVADWNHVSAFVNEAQIDTLNFIRIHELMEIILRLFRIDRWEFIPSLKEHGGERLTEEIRARFPEYYTEELQTEMVRCRCTKTEEPRPPRGRERPRRETDHLLVSENGCFVSLDITWCIRENHHCFITRIPPLPENITVEMWEDDHKLGPANALHVDIREHGLGRYSLWGKFLYFSTSDNTDPSKNGRTYSISIFRTPIEKPDKLSESEVKPVNLRPKDVSQEKLEEDVKHAIKVAENYLKVLPGSSSFLKDKVVMELGPGINFGAALILSCYGARIIVSDLYISSWDITYHPVFYLLLKETLEKENREIDLSPLDYILSENGYPSDLITCYGESVENLSIVPDNSVDIIFSAAVLEHLYNPQQAFHQMARITRPNGLGFHWVDLRDHRDFSNPLEYLLLSDKDFEEIFKNCYGELGNRYREDEMKGFIEKSGFIIKKIENYLLNEESYLDDFVPRLRKTACSPYRNYSREELKKGSALFHLVKIT